MESLVTDHPPSPTYKGLELLVGGVGLSLSNFIFKKEKEKKAIYCEYHFIKDKLRGKAIHLNCRNCRNVKNC